MMYHMYILSSFNIVQNIPVDVLIFRGRINFDALKLDKAEISNVRFKTSKISDLKKLESEGKSFSKAMFLEK